MGASLAVVANSLRLLRTQLADYLISLLLLFKLL